MLIEHKKSSYWASGPHGLTAEGLTAHRSPEMSYKWSLRPWTLGAILMGTLTGLAGQTWIILGIVHIAPRSKAMVCADAHVNTLD